MESFVVSARKYRPKGFDEVIGQEHITTTLKNAIDNNHLAQALLFCGPRGVGKTTCARIVARMINDFDASETEATLNIFELDAASNNSVDHIRNLIDQVRYPPQFGNYKVYIIDEVHMLSNTAFNAFLKTLEEPPSYAIFILATTEKHKVIPTILSRCQIYDFNRISISDIADHLKEIAEKESVKAEQEALHLIAQKADGALRDALSLFDLIVTFSSDNSITYQSAIDNLHILDYDYYFKMTDNLLNEDITSCMLLFDEILKKGFDGHNFIVGLSLHFRNLMVCTDTDSIGLLEVAENAKRKYDEQSKEASMSFLMSAINISGQCDIDYKSSKNQRLLVELALMKIAHIPVALKLADNISQEEDVKKKNELEPESQDTDIKIGTPEFIDTNESKQGGGEAPNENSNTAGGIPKSSASKILKSTTKLPSLDKLKQGSGERDKNSRGQNKETNETPDEPASSEDEDFSEAKFHEVWNEFKESKKISGKARELNVLSQPREISVSDNIVSITLTNSIQLDILKELKNELLQFLKEKLKNSTISVEGVLKKEDNNGSKLYTNKEKFEFLAEKNPMVKDLQKKFGLDPDY